MPMIDAPNLPQHLQAEVEQILADVWHFNGRDGFRVAIRLGIEKAIHIGMASLITRATTAEAERDEARHDLDTLNRQGAKAGLAWIEQRNALVAERDAARAAERKAREALRECADRFERCCMASGSDKECAAAAVERYRTIIAAPDNAAQMG